MQSFLRKQDALILLRVIMVKVTAPIQTSARIQGHDALRARLLLTQADHVDGRGERVHRRHRHALAELQGTTNKQTHPYEFRGY